MAALSRRDDASVPLATGKRARGHLPGNVAPPPRGRARGPAAWGVAALLAAFLLASYRHALSLGFISDDYLILDKVLRGSFGSLWEPRALLFNWYRPVSRELHYWTLSHLFGTQVLPFHLVSFALWVADMTLFFLLARRLAGVRTAALATAAVAALAAWAGPLLWVAGVQELWMLLYSFLFLHAFARRRTLWAVVTLALALLGKETAGVLPALALLWALLVDRERPAAALRRVAPLVALTALWTVFHPRLLGRMWGPYAETVETAGRPAPIETAVKTLLALFSLEERPAPESGWLAALARGLPGALALAALAAWAIRGGGREDARSRGASPSRDPGAATPDEIPGTARGIAALAASWAALGSLPLFLPSIGWHAYYGLFGAFGAWLLIAHALRRRPGLALSLVLALALLRPLRADTPSWDWASDAYQRRAGFFLRVLRDDLLRQRPAMPPHARLYFARVPRNIGWVAGDGPALRVWYRDTTITGGYYSYYKPRPAGAPAGPDHFFRFDSSGVWIEVTKGAEDVDAARARDPKWEGDHRELALLLGGAADWAGAAGELEKLATAFPGRFEYPLNAAVCYEKLGDSTATARWYARAASMPGATEREQSAARRYARHLKARP